MPPLPPINPTGPKKPRAPRKTPMMAVNPPKPVGGALADGIKPRVNPRLGPDMGRTGVGPSQKEQPGMSPPPPPPNGYAPPTGMQGGPGAGDGGLPKPPGMGQKAKKVGSGQSAKTPFQMQQAAAHKRVGSGQKAESEKAEKKAGKDNKREEMMEIGKGKKANPFTAKAKSMKGTKPAAFAAKMGAGKPKGFPSSDKRAAKGLRGGNNKPPFPMGMGQKKAKK